jgi:hypothetical protein
MHFKFLILCLPKEAWLIQRAPQEKLLMVRFVATFHRDWIHAAYQANRKARAHIQYLLPGTDVSIFLHDCHQTICSDRKSI